MGDGTKQVSSGGMRKAYEPNWGAASAETYTPMSTKENYLSRVERPQVVQQNVIPQQQDGMPARITAYGVGEDIYGSKTAGINPITGKREAIANFTLAGPKAMQGNYVELPDGTIGYIHDVGSAVEARTASGGKNIVLDRFTDFTGKKINSGDMGTGNVRFLGQALTPEQIDRLNILPEQKKVLKRRLGYSDTMIAGY